MGAGHHHLPGERFSATVTFPNKSTTLEVAGLLLGSHPEDRISRKPLRRTHSVWPPPPNIPVAPLQGFPVSTAEWLRTGSAIRCITVTPLNSAFKEIRDVEGGTGQDAGLKRALKWFLKDSFQKNVHTKGIRHT